MLPTKAMFVDRAKRWRQGSLSENAAKNDDMTMNILVAASQTLVGLFVDDGSLAIAILMIVLVSGICSILMSGMPLVAGAVLLIGCLGALFANVIKAAKE